MSLTVTDEHVEMARVGIMNKDVFMEIISTSLPFAFETVQRLADGLKDGDKIAIEAPLHMEDGDRGQLLRLFASTSMRRAVEEHFGITLAFQNCHAAAAVPKGKEDDLLFQRFISIEGQVMNQHPELRDC